MQKGISITFALVFTLVFGIWGLIRGVSYWSFENGCAGYLHRAASANTIQLAQENLDSAIKYLEDNNLTTGQVSIIMKQPKNNITYWYSNLKAAQQELQNMDTNATQLEVSNQLIKLKETLENANDSLICPDGIEVYPNNVGLFWMSIISALFAIIGWCWAASAWGWS